MSSRGAKHLERRRKDHARRRAAEEAAREKGPLGERMRRWCWRSALGGAALTIALTVPLRWLPPPSSSIILQRAAAAIRTSQPPPRYRWTPMEEISGVLAVAVIAAEDQKFPDHFGFDFDSISKVLSEPGAPKRGASTISQQVAKNLYLWPGRSLIRKALEAYWTLALETFLPKRRILEIYLNIAEFGPNCFGAGPGSRLHFNKAPAALGRAEAALLAATLPNPARFSASEPSDYVQERGDAILAEMNRIGGPALLKGLSRPGAKD